MKKFILAMCILSTSASFAAISSLTSFPEGAYLGLGYWLSDNGNTGSYATRTALDGNEIITEIYANSTLSYYEDTLSIDANGFFSVSITDASDPQNPVSYTGSGNCGSSQCQMTVALSNGTLQKSIVFDFANNKISSYGAIYYNDGTPNVQWQDTSSLEP
jgi:hypothetical protein